tara:strand:- start:672 stop:1403 length:732 start_codon:yes stop_codon:yes gene_type:complete
MLNKKNYSSKYLFSIKNKVCLITGSEGGMGKEVVKLLKFNGAKVIKLDRYAIKTKQQNYYKVDYTQKKDFISFSKEIKKKFKKIDCIINFAGVSDSKNFEKNFQVNIFGTFYLIKNIFKLISKKGCSIINITSLNSELGFKNNPGYNSSKGALKLLTKSMAVDFAKFNIRVNNIGPGFIKTPMTKKSFNNKIKKNKRVARMIIKKYGHPSDLFGIILYLISDSSSYVTGQDFYIDGGFLSKGI